jgi:hypothetical protein
LISRPDRSHADSACGAATTSKIVPQHAVVAVAFGGFKVQKVGLNHQILNFTAENWTSNIRNLDRKRITKHTGGSVIQLSSDKIALIYGRAMPCTARNYAATCEISKFCRKSLDLPLIKGGKMKSISAAINPPKKSDGVIIQKNNHHF